MHTEKTRLQHQIWPQKRGQFSDPQFVPFPIEGWFWGPLVGLGNGPRNSAFFLLLLPYHLGLNIWPAWPQLQRFSACQSGFTTKGSTCSKCPCTIIIICDQHSYYDCKHTHTYILIQCNSIISPKIMDQFSIPYTTRVLFFAQFHHLPKLPVLLGVNPPVFRPLRPHKPELQPSSFHQLLLQLMRFLCFKRIRIQ